MNYTEFKLKPTSPWMTPWQADTLFGHLAWEMYYEEGEEALQNWLEQFDNAPPLLMSDGFVGEWLPRPLLPIIRKQNRLTIEEVIVSKKRKGLNWMKREDIISGKWENEEVLSKAGELKKITQLHNVINRHQGSSFEKNGLYEQPAYILPKDETTISIYIGTQNKMELRRFSHYLKKISLVGYGKRKTVGMGQFEITEIIDRTNWFNGRDCNAVMWLAHGVPSELDPIKGCYKIDTKYGKLGEGHIELGTPFKKPLTRICPGAVFLQENINKCYAGRMIYHITEANPKVVQYGYTLTLPIKLDGDRLEVLATHDTWGV